MLEQLSNLIFPIVNICAASLATQCTRETARSQEGVVNRGPSSWAPCDSAASLCGRVGAVFVTMSVCWLLVLFLCFSPSKGWKRALDSWVLCAAGLGRLQRQMGPGQIFPGSSQLRRSPQ